jgi:Flp pilus assembly protein TadG
MIKKTLNAFRSQQDGSASVEFVLWMPVFVLITMLVIDTTVYFTSHASYGSVARDTARLVARHAMTELAAETYAAQSASGLWTAPTADVTITPTQVTVTLSAPGSSLSIFNSLGLLGDVQASVTQRMEPI